jgi:hypothetical protein
MRNDRPLSARIGHRLEAGLAGGDNSEFGEGEEAVETDQNQRDEKFKHGLPSRLASATRLLLCCRWSATMRVHARNVKFTRGWSGRS